MKYFVSLCLVLFLVVALIGLNTIYPVLPKLANATSRIADNVAGNWRGFLFDRSTKQPRPTSTPSNFEGMEIEDFIRAEIDRILAERLASGAGAPQGLIVAPPGTVNPDDIKQSFSDEVLVEPDATGRSGVITPIFHSGAGQPYIYVLTPIN